MLYYTELLQETFLMIIKHVSLGKRGTPSNLLALV